MIIIFILYIIYWSCQFLFMKVRSSIKKIDQDDQIVKRRGRLYVINKKKPRNKQRQGWLYYFLVLLYGILSLSFDRNIWTILYSMFCDYFFLCLMMFSKLYKRFYLIQNLLIILYKSYLVCFYIFVFRSNKPFSIFFISQAYSLLNNQKELSNELILLNKYFLYF